MITFPSIATIYTSRQSLSFQLSAGTKALVVMQFCPLSSSEWTEIWREEYHTVNGSVTIHSFGQLLKDCLKDCLMGQLKIAVTEYLTGSSPVDGETVYRCQYCQADLPSGFLDDGFFTLLRATKKTFVGAREDVYWYREDGRFTPKVVAEYLKADDIEQVVYTEGNSSRVSMQHSGLPVPSLYKIDMSPSRFVDEDRGQLVHLTLCLENGDNTFVKQYDVTEDEAKGRFMFRNSLGVPETLYTFGTLSTKIDFKRTAAVIDGMKRNYSIEEERVFKALTGIMSQDEARWAEDLLRSEETYVLTTENAIFKEIIIVDSKAERSSDDDERPNFEFSYQYSQNMQNAYSSDDIAARIFDNSFDQSFE